MSDGFSWAPFGPSPDDKDAALPPLPPLAPFEQDEEGVPAPEPELEFPLDLEHPEPDPEPLIPPPPPAPVPSAPPPVVSTLETPWGQVSTEIAPAKRERPKIKKNDDAGQAFVWGILGLTICPILIPSIAAVRIGNRARARHGGLGGNSGLATAGIVLGWIGIILWACFIALVVFGIAITE